jgi:hypothetical protein
MNLSAGIAMFHLGACVLLLGGATLSSGDQSQNETSVDVRGVIKKIELKGPKDQPDILGTILVEGSKDEKDVYYAAAKVKVTGGTKISRDDGKGPKPAAFKDLKEGQRVEVIFAGLVYIEKDPVEGKAGKVTILPMLEEKK